MGVRRWHRMHGDGREPSELGQLPPAGFAMKPRAINRPWLGRGAANSSAVLTERPRWADEGGNTYSSVMSTTIMSPAWLQASSREDPQWRRPLVWEATWSAQADRIRPRPHPFLQICFCFLGFGNFPPTHTPLWSPRPFLWPPFKSQCNLFGSYLSPTQRLINRAESLFLLHTGRHPVFFAICERLTEESWLLSVLLLNPQSPIPAISTISETFLSATMLQNSR